MRRVAVVGASLAGVNAAQTLRRADENLEIVIVGDEQHYPYDRPPLSKEFLLSDGGDEARLRLRPAVDPDELGVEWALGRRATGLDRSSPDGTVDGTVDGSVSIAIDGGPPITADGAIIATGARPRSLPGSEGIGGVHLLRTLDDARALRADFDQDPQRVVVIGCGFIGAEVAASARQRGLDVTIIETAQAPLLRVLDESAGMAVADLHRSHGVDVRLGVGVTGFQQRDQRVGAVELDDGSVVETSVVVVGIGVVPNTEWLAGSGLELEDGVVTDETCMAAPGIVAVGDVARWPNRRFGSVPRRFEQWDNAVEMGSYGAKRLLAHAAGEAVDPYQPVPWFWSDQYDRKIQLAGVPAPTVEVVQGTVAEQRFVQMYIDADERVTGVLCWNRPRQAIMARQLIASEAGLDEIRQALG